MADRFDKFTERARRVLTLAQEEAQRFNHNYIGTEHLLLGLVREGDGVAAKVLSNLGVARRILAPKVSIEPSVLSVEGGQSDDVGRMLKRVIGDREVDAGALAVLEAQASHPNVRGIRQILSQDRAAASGDPAEKALASRAARSSPVTAIPASTAANGAR